MEFRKIFDTIPKKINRWRLKYCDGANAEDYVQYLGTHCDHIVLQEPYKQKFFEGVKEAILNHGDKIEFNNTIILYLTRKP